MDFKLTIPHAKVKAEYDRLVTAAVAKAEIAGFRKGKAPRDLVEAKLDKSQLYQTVLENLLPEFITQLVKDHQLKPIATPRLKPISMTEDKDWEFTVEVAEAPQITLGDYQQHVAGALRSTKLWTPGKKDEPDKRLSAVFDVLLEHIKFDLPALVVEDETNRALSHLISQLQKLGVTLEQYLESIKSTPEKLRQEYATTATTNLKLEFILQAIAADMRIEVSDAEIQALPQKDQLPQDKTYIKHLLTKRKTIDALLKLA